MEKLFHIYFYLFTLYELYLNLVGIVDWILLSSREVDGNDDGNDDDDECLLLLCTLMVMKWCLFLVLFYYNIFVVVCSGYDVVTHTLSTVLWWCDFLLHIRDLFFSLSLSISPSLPHSLSSVCLSLLCSSHQPPDLAKRDSLLFFLLPYFTSFFCPEFLGLTYVSSACRHLFSIFLGRGR